MKQSTAEFNLHTKSPRQWRNVLEHFFSQNEGWMFDSQPRHTYVVKTGSDSSTAKRSAIGVSVTGPRR